MELIVELALIVYVQRNIVILDIIDAKNMIILCMGMVDCAKIILGSTGIAHSNFFMEYTIEIDGKSFTGSVTTMLGSAFNGIKDYIIPAFRELVSGKKYSDKWNMAKKFLKEYFELIIFLKERLGKKVHPAVKDLLKAADFEGDEILKFLDKCKTPAISSIARQIRGKIDSSDVLDIFLDNVADADDDDDWED